jgi:hypothetical protein
MAKQAVSFRGGFSEIQNKCNRRDAEVAETNAEEDKFDIATDANQMDTDKNHVCAHLSVFICGKKLNLNFSASASALSASRRLHLYWPPDLA